MIQAVESNGGKYCRPALTFPLWFAKRCFTRVCGDLKLSCVGYTNFSRGPWRRRFAWGLAFVLSGGSVLARGPGQASPGLQTAKAAENNPPQHPAASQTGNPTENKQAGVSAASQAGKAAEGKQPELPAQIELLETRVRFEANGDSRKEVHTRVHINNELGVRQFARLNFDYNRSFQQVELPIVRITHASGGTADILPGAITDQPNPAVVNFPAYQDVRVKSVRILGLEPGDLLEYRVVTTTTKHPLAPDFWLDHTFDRSGVVSQEIFELDLPGSRNTQVRINPATPAASTEHSGEGDSARVAYHWEISRSASAAGVADSSKEPSEAEPDVALSTTDWFTLSIHLDGNLTPGAKRLESVESDDFDREVSRRYRDIDPEIVAKAAQLTSATQTRRGRLEALYNFVSQKIATVDLPLGSAGFVARPAQKILSSGYATQEDKFVLFAALAAAAKLGARAGLTGYCDQRGVPRPTVFKHLLIRTSDIKNRVFWLDPSLEVAPFGVVAPNSGRCAFVLDRDFYSLSSTGHEWEKLETEPPFPSTQRVSISAVVGPDGTLKSKVQYSMRGQNELLLRVAFHQASKEKWKEVAQLLALSDGFRGKVTNVTASDPYATKEPFRVEYEITQAKFVDWAKKPVRIPALLPLVALPEVPAKAGGDSSPIELGTPLDVQTRVTLKVPPDTSVRAPAGTSVARDYATFASEYSARNLTLTAERHIKFVLREVSAEHAADYAAFVRSVQNDQAQEFTLERGDSGVPQTTPAKASSAASSHP